MEVLYIDIFVGSCLSLAPEEEAFLGRHLFNGDVLKDTKNKRVWAEVWLSIYKYSNLYEIQGTIIF